MASLKDSVVSRTLDRVEVVYLDRATASWWNARRGPLDTATFCGWYWIRGDAEAGPFKTRSATLRDAYYNHVLGSAPPNVGHAMMPGFRRNRIKRRTAEARA